jgi:4-amino-4-deoxy-L-arabinose transferase-like glycosyltransferase
MIAGAQRLLGDDELAARLPAALLGVAGVAAVYLIGRRLAGRGAGLLAAAILAAAPQWLRFSRQAMLDVPLATALSCAMLGALVGSWPLMGGALGAALLLKGPAALVALPPLAALAIGDRRSLPTVAKGLGLAAVLATPWHLTQIAIHGRAFAAVYLGTNVGSRLALALDGNSGPWWYYLEYVFFHWVNPWHWLGAAAVVAATWTAVRTPRRADLGILVVWFWTVLVGYSCATTKLHWYVMPAYPALAVLTGAWAATHMRPRRSLRIAAGALALATLALGAGEVALRRLRNRPAESTRAALRALPPRAEAPLLWVADSVPIETARYYGRRPIGRWPPASPPPEGAWVLALPEDAAAAAGRRVVAGDGLRVLLGPL